MDYFKDHWTLSEWLAHSARRDELIAEDASKRSRLEVLRERAGIPSVGSVKFAYRDLLNHDSRVQSLAEECGATAYALRLNPREGGEVLRQRNLPVRQLFRWARDLNLPRDAFECILERHVDSRSSAIFVSTESGVWGEFHHGPLLDLNRGSGSDRVLRFNLPWRQPLEGLPELVRRALNYLAIRNEDVRSQLAEECRARFSEDHLLGYFEVIVDASDELWFVDYNRLLIADAPLAEYSEARRSGIVLRGHTGARGKGRGRVQHVPGAGWTPDSEPTVLVARATQPEFIEMMASSRAVVTEIGGVLSHAAIACRELGVPCLVGVKGAVSTLAEGLEVIVDADEGRVDVVTGDVGPW